MSHKTQNLRELVQFKSNTKPPSKKPFKSIANVFFGRQLWTAKIFTDAYAAHVCKIFTFILASNQKAAAQTCGAFSKR